MGENYSSAVKYWMPFNGNVGMHDASWRSEFGGWQYIINGSHGCINLPTEKAAEIYEIVEKGECVFVYGGKTVPEAVVEKEVTDPATGEVKVIKMPKSAADELDRKAQEETEGTVSEDNSEVSSEQNSEVTTENVESADNAENSNNSAGEGPAAEGATPSN